MFVQFDFTASMLRSTKFQFGVWPFAKATKSSRWSKNRWLFRIRSALLVSPMPQYIKYINDI